MPTTGIRHELLRAVRGTKRGDGLGEAGRRGGFHAESKCPADAGLNGSQLGLEPVLLGQDASCPDG